MLIFDHHETLDKTSEMNLTINIDFNINKLLQIPEIREKLNNSSNTSNIGDENSEKKNNNSNNNNSNSMQALEKQLIDNFYFFTIECIPYTFTYNFTFKIIIFNYSKHEVTFN